MRRRLLSLLVVLLGLVACFGVSAGAESPVQLVIVGVPGESSDSDPDGKDGDKYDIADRDSWYTAELNGHVYCCFGMINAFSDPSKLSPLASLWGAERFCESLGGHLATLTSSEEGRVFWMEKDRVLSSNWIWHMDGLMRIMDRGEFAELWLDAADGWRPVLK